MPRTRSILWAELKLGVVGVAAALLTIVAILAVGGQGGFFWQRYGLKARFDEIQGLKTGAVVRVNGLEVGKVVGVAFSGTQVEVGMEIARTVRPLVTSDSMASIGSLSLLGEPIIDIKAASTGDPLGDWAYVRTAPPAKSIGDLTKTASTGLEEISGLMSGLRAGQGTLGKLITDETLYKDLTQFVASATAVTNAMKSGRGTIGRLADDPAAYTALKGALENLQTATARLNSGQGALGKLLGDEALAASLGSSTRSLEQITGRLQRGEGTAGKLLVDQQVYDNLNQLTKRVDDLVGGLSDGRGTVGQLLRDRQLYENMNRAVTELRDLLADIRKDPKKYLRVSVSIF